MPLQVDLIIQGKGGVGKSMFASWLTQYHQSKKRTVHLLDTDPVNATISNYDALNPVFIDIMDKENETFNERKFDDLIEILVTAQKELEEADSDETRYVIDSGASSFVPMAAYLKSNDALKFLAENDVLVNTHMVIVGGQSLGDTLEGFDAITKTAENIYIWINDYYGRVEKNEKTFEDMQVYLDNQDKVKGLIHIPRRNQNTFAVDIEEMLVAHQTFEEAIANPNFTMMSRQRLNVVRNETFAAIEKAGL